MKKVHVKQVKRHCQEPTVKITMSLAKRLLKKAGIKPEQGTVYNFYNCGHIFRRDEDACLLKCMKNSKGDARSQRICPICWEKSKRKEPLITKYKRCTSCDAEHIGIKLQESICCAACSAARKAKKGEDPDWEIHDNEHLADPNRCYCIHRKECIAEYAKYATVPCKGCRRFKEKEGQWY